MINKPKNKTEIENIKALEDNKIPYRYVNDSTVSIRMLGVPKIDYYVSKNKWKVSTRNSVRYHQSNAKGFINWFKKRYGYLLRDWKGNV